MRIVLNACFLGLMLLVTGCGSVASHWNGERGAYPGVRLDADCVTHPAFGEEIIVPLAAADIPLSAVLDTFFLPYDLTAKEQTTPSELAISEPPAGASGTRRIGYAR